MFQLINSSPSIKVGALSRAAGFDEAVIKRDRHNTQPTNLAPLLKAFGGEGVALFGIPGLDSLREPVYPLRGAAVGK